MDYSISEKISDVSQSDKIKWVDSMKGIAICGVVMAHTGASTLPSVLGIIGGNGNRGVQLFFVISGYLTFLSLHNNKDSINFWWFKKFAKLAPLYYIALVIGTMAEGRVEWLGREEHISTLNFVVHLLFLHGFVPHYCNSIIGGEWYLGTLTIFFMIAPLLYKYINTLERAFYSLIAFIALSCLNIIVSQVCVGGGYWDRIAIFILHI